MRTICLDFDGVLNNYTGWRGPDQLGDPLPGAREFLARLAADDWTVVVHSTRPAEQIRAWLHDHDMLYVGGDPITVTDRKLPATVYLDDRGITFTGDYDAALAAIDGFRAWWEAPDSDGGVARVKR